MDENARRRRQDDQSFSASDLRLNPENQIRGFPGPSAERYRSASSNTPQSSSRGMPSGAAYSGYYQVTSPPFPSNLHYQTTASYGQDQRQQSQAGFGAYSPEMMYNVSQQTPQSSTYQSTAQFQTRQPAAIQLLSDVANPCFSSESASAPETPNLQHHAASSSASTVYTQHQQSSGDRSSILQPGYSSITMANMSQTADVMDPQQFTTPGPGMEAAYASYQTALKEIFTNIVQARLSEAGQSLLEISEWLLGHVAELDRIRLWGEFNSAWLGIFQKQKDLLESGTRILPPQNVLPRDFVNKMAKNLVRMCDLVEKYGLVDYQLGVAEERIMTILIECLDIQEAIENEESGTASQSSGIGRAPS